jgi:hypothetical protein
LTSAATGNIVVTLNFSVSRTLQYYVYVSDTTQLNSTTPATGGGSTDSGTSISASASGTTGGFAVGIVSMAAGSGPATITGYTSDDTSNSHWQPFHNIPIGSTGTQTATATWTGANQGSIVFATWD